MPVREAAQCSESVINLDAIERRMTPAARDYRGGGAARDGLREIVVAVGRRAVQRDE